MLSDIVYNKLDKLDFNSISFATDRYFTYKITAYRLRQFLSSFLVHKIEKIETKLVQSELNEENKIAQVFKNTLSPVI